jgi:hypothetical protein
MLSADDFENLLAIVRVCVSSNRADLIEPALVGRLHVGEVAARIEAERTTTRAPVAASTDVLANAIRRRFETYAKGGT